MAPPGRFAGLAAALLLLLAATIGSATSISDFDERADLNGLATSRNPLALVMVSRRRNTDSCVSRSLMECAAPRGGGSLPWHQLSAIEIASDVIPTDSPLMSEWKSLIGQSSEILRGNGDLRTEVMSPGPPGDSRRSPADSAPQAR